MLWPFATSAVAINLVLLGLIGLAVGLPSMQPVTALWLSLPLGLPATWAAAHRLATTYPDGTFRPTTSVTRAKLALGLFALAGDPTAWTSLPADPPPAVVF